MLFENTYQKFFDKISTKINSILNYRIVIDYFLVYLFTSVYLLYNFEVVKTILFQILTGVMILANIITLGMICVYTHYHFFLSDEVKIFNNLFYDYISYLSPRLLPSNNDNKVQKKYKDLLNLLANYRVKNRDRDQVENTDENNNVDSDENNNVDSDTETEN